MALSEADRKWLKEYREQTGCSLTEARRVLAEQRFSVQHGDLGERVIPVCSCSVFPWPHVHIP